MTDTSRATYDSKIASLTEAEAIGDLGTAASLCVDAMKLLPSNASLFLWLGWIYFNDKRYIKALDCASAFIEADPSRKADGYRLLIFSAGACGAWERADHAFHALASVSPDAGADVAGEAIGSFFDYMRSRYAAEDYESIVRAYERLPDAIGKLRGDDKFDIDLMAQQAFTILGKNRSGFRSVLGDGAAAETRRAIHDERPLGGVTFVTSIAPSRQELQSRAVKSWENAGAKVVSVNSPHEIEALHGQYPSVKFMSAPRDAAPRFGKPYVYISDMISIGMREDADVLGIINSDIVIRSSEDDYLRMIKDEARYSLVFGHRFDVDRIHDISERPVKGETFAAGFDWFMFARRDGAHFADQPFVFGCPWWDLWLPVMASISRMDLCIATGKIAYHERHLQRWKGELFEELGLELIDEVRKIAAGSGYCARRIADFGRYCDEEIGETLATARLVERYGGMIKALVRNDARQLNE